MVEMLKVLSSNMEEAGYDESAGELHVKFKGNPDTYVYPGLPRETYEEMSASPSVGSFFHARVKLVVDKELVRRIKPETPRSEP